jgi:signal transduction histidine kinase
MLRAPTGWQEESGTEFAAGATSVAACLGDVEVLLRGHLGPDVRLAAQAPGDLAMVGCDRGRLRDALLNLVFNARDAMPAGGAISIVASNGPRHLGQPEVALHVIDQGIGMAPDTLAVAIEPCFTTKTTGLGGLGLYLVERFVAESGGRLEIVSVPAHGTTVTLRLPAVDMR